MPHGLCYACALTAVSHECNALGLCSIVLLCLLETCQKLTIACIQHAGRCAHMPAQLVQSTRQLTCIGVPTRGSL